MAQFSEKFFFRKKSKIWMELGNKIQKKFGNHVKVRHQPFPIFNFEFFLFTWSENPKYKNSQKNEKILKKRASLHCTRNNGYSA